jgi:hypothetical protein
MTLCGDCEYAIRDTEMRVRCHSPQLIKLGTPGILALFERDSHPEEGRSHKDGTGKCGPAALNKKERIGI